MEEFLKVKGLEKVFPINNDKDTLTVFRNINFEVKKGEFVSIIGHSGCGKSTVLNSLAGLDSPSSGEISVLGKPCLLYTSPSPRDKRQSRMPSSA